MFIFAIWKALFIPSLFLAIAANPLACNVFSNKGIFGRDAHEKYIEYGVDVEGAESRYQTLFTAHYQEDQEHPFESHHINSFPFEYEVYTTSIQITKIEITINMNKDNKKAVYNATVIEGGLGKNYANVKVTVENDQNVDYFIRIYFVYDTEIDIFVNLAPKKIIEYAYYNSVDDANLFTMNQYAEADYDATEFLHSFPLHVDSNRNYKYNIRRVTVLFDKYDDDAEYNAYIIGGGIGEDHVDLKIKAFNAIKIKYKVNIYYCIS